VSLWQGDRKRLDLQSVRQEGTARNHFGPPIAHAAMPHDVVISHSTPGKLTASAICSELESIGIRCWILPRDLNIGIAWERSIANAVRCCRIMIVVLSDYANRSDRVERQLEHAFNSEVIIIPFRTESTSVVSDAQPSLDSVHWLDAMTPEMRHRLRSLSDLVRGLIVRQKDGPLPLRALAMAQEEILPLSIERLTELPQPDATKDKLPLAANDAVAELAEADSEKNPLEGVVESVSEGNGGAVQRPKKTSKWLPIKALLLMLLPFAIVCSIGLWHAKERSKSVAAATASTAPPIAMKVQHQDKFAASDPGWGTLDANWTATDGRLQVTPLLNSSAVLINHARGFTDAEISAEIVMSKGDDLDQLGGLIFWAKDYNDCYALVVSADGKFALGRKLIGRWINPIAKTGNAAIKTGIGQTNKLRVQTAGNLLTASINDIQVATVAGEPPQGISYIGLYGESAETTQNAWEFSNVTVTSAH
jgi:TIR domain